MYVGSRLSRRWPTPSPCLVRKRGYWLGHAMYAYAEERTSAADAKRSSVDRTPGGVEHAAGDRTARHAVCQSGTPACPNALPHLFLRSAVRGSRFSRQARKFHPPLWVRMLMQEQEGSHQKMPQAGASAGKGKATARAADELVTPRPSPPQVELKGCAGFLLPPRGHRFGSVFWAACFHFRLSRK